jgi:acyl-CoA thioesterase FadM
MTSIVRLGGAGDEHGKDSEHGEDSVELARARTTWALLSMDSGRPVRIPTELRDRFIRPVL